jgi:DNA-directed RNA polymerase subunit omega
VARVTVEDCLEQVHNRFALVILAAQRARQIARGEPGTVECDNKPAVTSLREIAEGHVRFREDVTDTIKEFIEERRASGFM